MPGSGDHPDRRQIGDKIKDEVLSTLRLLFRQVDQQVVDLELPGHFTTYDTRIPGEPSHVPIPKAEIAVSEDPIRILSERRPAVHALPLMTVTLAPATPCEFDPVPCHEPVFDKMDWVSHGVGFENVQLAENRPWPVEPLQARQHDWPTNPVQPPASKPLPTERLGAESHDLLEKLPQGRARHSPRFYALPIRKSPIPPHRFASRLREQFRQALAEKAKTQPSNIQLRIVYDRMDIGLFSAMQQDEQGNLLCTPRGELLGKNQAIAAAKAMVKPKSAGQEQAAYLVFGVRLDNQEVVRALVPVDTTSGGVP